MGRGEYQFEVRDGVLRRLSVDGRVWIAEHSASLVRCASVAGDELNWDTPVVLGVDAMPSEGGGVVGRLQVDVEEGSLVLGLTIENRTAAPIGAIEYPCLGSIDAAAGSKIAWPLMAGASLPLDALGPDECLEMGYPVYASMQWMDLFERDGCGLYLGMHDPAPHLKFLHAGRRGGRGWMSCEWFGLMVQPGERFEFPPVVIAGHENAWRGGAEIYRAWLSTVMRRRAAPRWMVDEPTTVKVMMREQDEPEPRVTFTGLPPIAERVRAAGGYTLHLVGYMERGHDTDYPSFRAGESLGGSEALAAANEGVKRAGCELAFYSNGRLMDSSWSQRADIYDFAVKLSPWIFNRLRDMWDRVMSPDDKGWDPRSAFYTQRPDWNRDGRAATEGWGHTLAVCCPGSASWREILVDQLVSLVREYRPRMMQLDQVCGCWSWACMDDRHDHDRPSLAWASYRPFMQELRRQFDEIDPQLGCWSEGVNDLLGESFDALQFEPKFTALLGGKASWMPELFTYTCPGPLMLTGGIGIDDFSLLDLMLTIRGFFFLELEPLLSSGDAAPLSLASYLAFVIDVRKRHGALYAHGDVHVVDAPDVDDRQTVIFQLGDQALLASTPRWRRESGAVTRSEVALTLPEAFAQSEIIGQDKFDGNAPDARIVGRQLSWTGLGPLIVRLGKCNSRAKTY